MALSEVEELEMLRLRKQKALASVPAEAVAPAPAGPVQARVATIPMSADPAEDARMQQAEQARVQQAQARPKPGALQKGLGTLETAAAVTSSMVPATVGMALAGIDHVVKTGLGALFGGPGSPVKDLEAAMTGGAAEGAKMGYQPRTEAGQGQLEAVGEFATRHGSSLGPTPVGPLGQALTNTARNVRNVGPVGAATQAARPAVQAVAKIPEAAGTVAAKAVAAVTPKIAPETAAVVQKAAKLGIDLPPDAFSKSKFARITGEAARNVPLSGAGGEANAVAFNRTLARRIGAPKDADKITPKVFDEAMTQSGETIGRITEANPVPASAIESTVRTMREGTKKRSGDVGKAVESYLVDLEAKAAENNGVVPGKAMKEILGEMGKDARTAENGNVRNALGELHRELTGDVAKILGPEDAATLRKARQQYSDALVIAPLVGPLGDISPAAFNQAFRKKLADKVRAGRGKGGEMGDLAEVSQFMREPSSSLTAERAAVYATLAGGVGVEPLSAAGVAAGANAYNRLGPRVMREKAGVKKGASGGVDEPAPAPPAPPPGPPELALVDPDAPIPTRPTVERPVPLAEVEPTTSPGAAPEKSRLEVVPEEGLIPALDDEAVTTGRERGELQMPAVPGRPDLPDTIVTGGPAESAASEAAGAAMGSPGAVEARRVQAAAREAPEAVPEVPAPPPVSPELAEIAKLRESAPPAVRAVLDAHAAKLEKTAKQAADVDALETAAKATTDPELRAALQGKADRLRAEKIPAGETVEGQPKIPTEGAGKIPAGKATEGPPAEKPAPKPEKVPTGEATEVDMPADLFEAAKALGIETRGRRPSEVRAAGRKAVHAEFKPNKKEAALADEMAAFPELYPEFEALVVKHGDKPSRALDEALRKRLEKAHADEAKQAAENGEGAEAVRPEGEKGQADRRGSGVPAAAAERPGADSPAAGGTAGTKAAPEGPRESTALDKRGVSRKITVHEPERLGDKPVSVKVEIPGFAEVEFAVDNDGVLAAGIVKSEEGFRGQGLAELLYQAARDAGYDIRPGPYQTPNVPGGGGKGLVDRLVEKGVINKPRTARGFEKGKGD